FFQAEDGIRDFHVTGVQTCALPILDAQRNRAVGQQVDVVGRLQGEARQLRIRLEQLLLPDLELGQARIGPDEVDSQVVLPAASADRKSVVKGKSADHEQRRTKKTKK